MSTTILTKKPPSKEYSKLLKSCPIQVASCENTSTSDISLHITSSFGRVSLVQLRQEHTNAYALRLIVVKIDKNPNQS